MSEKLGYQASVAVSVINRRAFERGALGKLDGVERAVGDGAERAGTEGGVGGGAGVGVAGNGGVLGDE